MEYFALFDLSLFSLYTIILISIAWFIRTSNQANPAYYYLLPGLTLKIFGSICFVIVYVFYFKVGDTFAYYGASKNLNSLVIDNPFGYLKLLFSKAGTFYPELQQTTSKIHFYHLPQEYLMVKITALFLLPSLGSYLVANLLMSCFAFFGFWKLYKSLLNMFANQKVIALSLFFIPSVFFWGAGLLKDTISIGFLGILIHSILVLIEKRQFSFIVPILISAYVIFTLKGYILLSLIPGVFFMIYSRYKFGIKDPILRTILAPIIFSFILGIGGVLIYNLSVQSERYSMDKLEQEARGFHSWHTTLSKQGQSGYSLGEIDYTLTGVVKKIPAAINVAIFRPYLWEVNNPAMLLSALESFSVLIISIYLLFRLGIRRIVFEIKYNPFLQLCFYFTIILAFATGFTSYNFGALARYKIPFLPFLSILLLHLLGVAKTNVKDFHKR